MQKIKKFKIQVRPREVVRALRANPSLQPLPVDVGEQVQALLDRQHLTLLPAAVYETCPPDQLIPELIPQLAPGAVAVSTIIATIGDALPDGQTSVESGSLREAPFTEAFWEVFRQQAVDHAVGFIARLLAEDAAREDCTLSERRSANAEAVPNLVARLGANRIGVRWEADRLVPVDSQAVLIPWLPLAKRRRK
ncbi:MAG: hypothetical protein HYZ73_05025 [Elusimicrobia bacterium]|nr:hypothetical protein [Elusimicrobiota bacterium]